MGQEVALTFVLPRLYRKEKAPEVKPRRRSIFAQTVESDLTEPQRLLARVRHRGPSDTIGLEFSNLPPAHRTAIQHYIIGASQD